MLQSHSLDYFSAGCVVRDMRLGIHRLLSQAMVVVLLALLLPTQGKTQDQKKLIVLKIALK